MCFATISGNTITFHLKPGWHGSIAVSYEGSIKKRTSVDWGIPGSSPVDLESCSTGPTALTTKTNESAAPLTVGVSVFYKTAPCTSGAPVTDAWNGGTETGCSETPSSQNATFTFEGVGTGETVQIVIDTQEDDAEG